MPRGSAKRRMTDSDLDEDLREDDVSHRDHVLSHDATEYYMNHHRRGVAAIFNEDKFDNSSISARKGSEVDCQTLQRTFTRLGFDVETHRDLTLAQIQDTLLELSTRNHDDCDCFVLVFMTHGREGQLRASDSLFDINLLWNSFTAEKCPTLITKPKLFFIQACQGHAYQRGVRVSDLEEDPQLPEVRLVPSYQLPERADFLVALSTIPGFVSWRSHREGSWYIQTLCQELDNHGFDQDILTLLTNVSRRVAVEYSYPTPHDATNPYKKQLPSLISMLIRTLKFRRSRRNSKRTIKTSKKKDTRSKDEAEGSQRKRKRY